MTRKINMLGDSALRRVIADPSLDTLGEAGEWFSQKLGLMSLGVKKLVTTAKSAGALHASQNMIGHAMHAIVPPERVKSVARALASSSLKPRVDTFKIGREKAGVRAQAELRYATVTSSFV